MSAAIWVAVAVTAAVAAAMAVAVAVAGLSPRDGARATLPLSHTHDLVYGVL